MTTYIHTPDGAYVVAEVVLERLIAEGFVTREKDGKLTAPDATLLKQQIGELGICDFCSAPEARHIIQTTDFPLDVSLSHATLNSTGGAWAACDACYELIQKNARAELLRRAIDRLAHGKFTAAAIAGLHKQFWAAREEIVDAAGIGAALVDYVEDTLPESPVVETDRDKRRESIKKLTGLTDDELDALATGDVAYKQVGKKLVAWHKRFGVDKKGVRKMLEMSEAAMRRPLPPGHVPHWQQAIDARFSVLSTLQNALRAAPIFSTPDATDLNDPTAVQAVIKKAATARALRDLDFMTDVKFLHVADAYSFNAETIAAIQEAAKSIPHDSPLSSIETPNTGAGWFWFSQPLPIATAPEASNETVALLWGWDSLQRREDSSLYKRESGQGEAVLRFSAFVIDKKSGTVSPSTKWLWPLSLSFHDMIGLSTAEYREAYGPGGRFEGRHLVAGEKETLRAVADLSLFFLAACVWFKQKILVSAPGHVERHARKRYVREHKLKEPPSVKVIALRASLREPAQHEPSAPSEKTREYQCRWIVRGHARLQPCGPGRGDRKLIWIDPHPAGPEDKPLRTRERVYAVIR